MKFIASLFSLFFAVSAWATQQTQIILANPPGSSSDIVARAIAQAYQAVSGHQLILDYVPGGDHIPAATKFKNRNQNTVLLGSTTMHIYNYATKNDLPYNDRDFEHVTWIGSTPYIYYVKPDSALNSMVSVITALNNGKSLKLGLAGTADLANVLSIKQKYNIKDRLSTVKYKGSPQVLVDVLGGHIDIGVGSLSNMLVEQIKSGKILVIGITTAQDITVAGQTLPSAARQLDVTQFNGGFLLSVKPGTSASKDGQKFIDDLRQAVRSDSVRTELDRISIRVDGRDGSATTTLIQANRKSAIELLR